MATVLCPPDQGYIRDDLLLPAPLSQLNPLGYPEVKQCPVFYPYASPRESEFINFSTKPANHEIAGSKFPNQEEREASLTTEHGVPSLDMCGPRARLLK